MERLTFIVAVLMVLAISNLSVDINAKSETNKAKVENRADRRAKK